MLVYPPGCIHLKALYPTDQGDCQDTPDGLDGPPTSAQPPNSMRRFTRTPDLLPLCVAWPPMLQTIMPGQLAPVLRIRRETLFATRRNTSTRSPLSCRTPDSQPVSLSIHVSPYWLISSIQDQVKLTSIVSSPQRRPTHQAKRLGRLVQCHRHRLRRAFHHQHRRLVGRCVRLDQARWRE